MIAGFNEGVAFWVAIISVFSDWFVAFGKEHILSQIVKMTICPNKDLSLISGAVQMSTWTWASEPCQTTLSSDSAAHLMTWKHGHSSNILCIHHARDTRLVQVRHTLYVISRLPSWPDAHLRGLRQIGLILAAPKMLIRCGYESPPHHHTGAVLGELQEAVVYMGEGYALCRGEGC